jgi:hypothetical protein
VVADGGVHSQVGWRDQQRGGVFGEGLSSVHPKGLMFGKGGWSIQFGKGHLNRQKGEGWTHKHNNQLKIFMSTVKSTNYKFPQIWVQ